MKVSLSVPDPVFDAAEELAGELELSRSQLYSQALAAYLDSRRATEITARLNELYAAEPSAVDAGLSRVQLRCIDHEAW